MIIDFSDKSSWWLEGFLWGNAGEKLSELIQDIPEEHQKDFEAGFDTKLELHGYWNERKQYENAV